MSASSRCRARDEGFTLVELLVVLVVLGIVLGGLYTFAIGAYRVAAKVDAETTDQGQARTGIAVLSRDIRAAAALRPETQAAFQVAEDDRAEFTANLGEPGPPQLVRIYVDGEQRLVEDVVPPTMDDGEVVWDPDDAVVRFVASFVANEADEPVFRYFDRDGDLLEPDPDLDLAQRRCIAAVELNVAVSSDASGRTGRFYVSHRVRLPNVVSVPAEVCE